MARIRRDHTEQDGERLVDPRRHFLGLLKKGGEILVYCRACRRFVSVMLQAFHRQPASRSPLDRLG